MSVEKIPNQYLRDNASYLPIKIIGTKLNELIDATPNLNYTSENVNNKVVNLTSPDNTKYPTTLVVSKALNVFNIVDYGAIEGNTFDNSIAIQNTINAAQNAGGGVVLIPIGIFKCTTQLNIVGATQTDGFDNGGITIRGVSQRGSKLHISGGITGIHFGPSSKMMCHLEDLEIYGDGLSTVGSRAIYWENTGGSYTWKNLYIHDLETGIEWYDHTLGTCINVNLRYCGVGIYGGWNQDILNFIGCRFDYCTDAIYLGKVSVTHSSRDQEENCWNFIGCRISNNTGRGYFINDYGASGIKFQGCYFESNGKDGEIGVNGAGDNVGPIGISFDACYFTPVTNVPVAEGMSIYNPVILSFKDCKTVSPTAYTVFCKLYDENARVKWESNSIQATTAALVHQLINYNPINDDLIITSSIVYKRDAGIPNLTTPWIDYQMTGGTGKQWTSWNRRNGSTNAVLGEIRVQDVGGVLHLEGITNGFIAATNVISLPTPTINFRGCQAFVAGNGTTTADIYYICLMSSSGTYSWKQIISG